MDVNAVMLWYTSVQDMATSSINCLPDHLCWFTNSKIITIILGF